ncbi:MAG: GHKL domain-containing protein, partial [Acidobacteriaceae bacterium]|nr:GHKL domain-containing protein [Acidobacteriaceae bacterium]
FGAGLILADPETNYNVTIVLVLLTAFQIIEPHLHVFSSRRGQIWSIVIKMALSYLLVGWSHTFLSVYYLIFLIPIIAAANSSMFDVKGVAVVTTIATCAYLSFLLPVWPIDYSRLSSEDIHLFCLRACFLAVVAFIVYEQAKAKREEMRRTQEAAERLVESNRNLRRAEASLRRSERLAALGQLTAGLAHELRNPLGTIKASSEMLNKATVQRRPEVMSEMAGYIGSEVDRMNALISSFLDFARPLQIRPVEADLRAVAENVHRQHADLASRTGVKLALRMPDGPLRFDFDPDLLSLALSNLVQNAIQASKAGQEVELRVVPSDEDVKIFVTDHGSGIKPEHLENIFNPFFTTKPNGVGLGLAIVSKIADEHNGQIRVFSEPESGTRFELNLPKRSAQVVG